MTTYTDTSALVKLLHAEPETSALIEYLSGKPESLSSSELTIAELHRAGRRARVPHESTDVLLGALTLTPVTRSVLARAGRLLEPPGSFLKTGDAIHVLAAADLGATAFLTYDKMQARSAEVRGFAILSPGMADGWYHAV